MATPLTLGIDIGTGSAKGVLADVAGEFLATASRSYSYRSPVQGAAEQPPDDWWNALCEVIRDLLTRHPDARERLAAVGISGQGVAAVTIDADGRPVRDAMLWMDTRCSPQAEALANAHGERIAKISGKAPAAYAVEPKLMWLREHEPDAWKRVWKVMTTTGHINFRLTGRAVMNHSDAGILLAYDLRARAWSDECLSAMELPREIFCELAESSAVIGTVCDEAARSTGLPVGLPVVAGGEDTSSAGLAMGVTSASDVQLSMGTACTIYAPLPEAAIDARLLAFPHVLEGVTLLGGSMVSGGISVEWILKQLQESPASPEAAAALLKELSAAAKDVAPGSEGLIFLPYLAGELQPIQDGFARAVFFGLHLGTRREHLFRAVLEGTAYAIEHNLSVLRECGAKPERVFASGTPANNDLWCQIIADVTGLPLTAMSSEAGAAFGDAVLAAMGAGLIDDPLTMQRAHAKPRAQFAPRAEAHARYAQLFEIYRELYPRLRELFPRLQAMA